VLDTDVDTGVANVLNRAGHDCWRSTDGLAPDAEDDEVSVYADDRQAVVITHDREFTERRKKNTFGKHVRMTCEQPDACGVIEERLEELIPILEETSDIVVEVSATKVKRFPPKWT
jgi:predicted nuclease of predicted toxin-antitoxin system